MSSSSSSSPRPGFAVTPNATCLVTGSSGLCGARLVEMLLERGAHHVVAFDITPPDAILQERFRVAQETYGHDKISVCSGPEHGDLCSDAAVDQAFALAVSKSRNQKLDVVYHIGALVGPFFDRSKYHAVNHYGTIRIIDACRKYQVPKLVYSSSPSTRFTGRDITGQTEDELPMPSTWLAMYAEAKAFGEMAVSQAHDTTTTNNNSSGLSTISVAPHQIYGPYDQLFLPNLLETAGNGRLRIFGKGGNRISVTYVDNYAHGLMCGADALNNTNNNKSNCGGKFYIVTDGPSVDFWKFLNQAVVACGFTDLESKFHLPVWLLYGVSYLCNVITFLTRRKLVFKLNPFNVKMLVIDRYFSIANAQRDLNYEPLVDTATAWAATIAWFQHNWLPAFQQRKQLTSLNKKMKNNNLTEKTKTS